MASQLAVLVTTPPLLYSVYSVVVLGEEPPYQAGTLAVLAFSNALSCAFTRFELYRPHAVPKDDEFNV